MSFGIVAKKFPYLRMLYILLFNFTFSGIKFTVGRILPVRPPTIEKIELHLIGFHLYFRVTFRKPFS